MAMRFITDRKEIAKKMNIERVPVITMNIKECMKGYEHCYEGGHIEIKYPSNRYNDLYMRCTLKMFGDEKGNKEHHDAPWLYEKIALYEETVCLSNSFDASDVREMALWNNTRRADAGDEVIVLFDNGNTVWVRLMRIGKVRANVYPVAVLEDVA